jgi:hypothetical protein
MTNEQINIAIEEIIRPALHGNIHRPPRDFCNDLNAMHEVEMVLTEEQMAIYAWEIDKAFPPDQQDKIWFSRAYCFVHATAKQRAEAFLKTLRKWEE